MADTPPATAKPSSGSTFGFLGKKVFGKVPVWVIAVAAVGGYYWYTKYGPGKKTGATVTDPAGNTCSALNPATGYCPGTPEDAAAIASTSGADIGGTSGTVDTTGTGAGTGSGGTGSGGGTPAPSDTAPPPVPATPPPATTGAPPPVPVVPIPGTVPAGHAAAHKAHLAHEAHLAEERADAAQAARARRTVRHARVGHHPRRNGVTV